MQKYFFVFLRLVLFPWTYFGFLWSGKILFVHQWLNLISTSREEYILHSLQQNFSCQGTYQGREHQAFRSTSIPVIGSFSSILDSYCCKTIFFFYQPFQFPNLKIGMFNLFEQNASFGASDWSVFKISCSNFG